MGNIEGFGVIGGAGKRGERVFRLGPKDYHFREEFRVLRTEIFYMLKLKDVNKPKFWKYDFQP